MGHAELPKLSIRARPPLTVAICVGVRSRTVLMSRGSFLMVLLGFMA